MNGSRNTCLRFLQIRPTKQHAIDSSDETALSTGQEQRQTRRGNKNMVDWEQHADVIWHSGRVGNEFARLCCCSKALSLFKKCVFFSSFFFDWDERRGRRDYIWF